MDDLDRALVRLAGAPVPAALDDVEARVLARIGTRPVVRQAGLGIGAVTVAALAIGMIGAEQFARMKDGAIYINSARAGLHDLDALTKAVASGKLAGVGLDHFEGERLPKDHPLLTLPNTVLTPHIGGATYDTEDNHSLMIARDLEKLFAGEKPQFIANPEVL